MRYLSFLIVAAATFTLVSWLLDDKISPEIDKKKFEVRLAWPSHWQREDELMQGVKFINFYSRNTPTKELSICLKHFDKLGYDADGMGILETKSAIVRASSSIAKLTINIMPDEQGTAGSSITVQILPKPRKEDL